MKHYKLSDKIVTTIQKEFEKALQKYNNASQTFSFNYTPQGPKTTKKIKVYCLPTAWCKMMTLVQKTNTEIAWHMIVEKSNKTTYFITDVLVYPQTVTGSTVNTDDTKYALWVNALPDKEFNNLRGQGHSHVNMPTSPSGVDTGYYNDLLSTMTKGFYLFMILNKKEDMFIQLVDLDANLIYDSTDIVFEVASKQWAQNKWYTEAMKQISEPKPAWKNTKTTGMHRAYQGSFYDGVYSKEEEDFYGLK